MLLDDFKGLLLNLVFFRLKHGGMLEHKVDVSENANKKCKGSERSTKNLNPEMRAKKN